VHIAVHASLRLLHLARTTLHVLSKCSAAVAVVAVFVAHPSRAQFTTAQRMLLIGTVRDTAGVSLSGERVALVGASRIAYSNDASWWRTTFDH
jgi:hypothetical protein